MKKASIIIGSVILVIVLLGVAWWYLLMNGAPKNLLNIPNPFSFSGNTSGQFATSTATTTPTEAPRAAHTKLRKISTSPVAGAVVFSRDGAEYVRYVERGTGHIFEVGVAGGITTRITGTTIPRTTRAIWSPQGSRVALITDTANDTERIFAGAIERTDAGEGALTTVELDPTARNIAFASSSESVFYTTPTSVGSTGYAQNLKTNTRTTRFTSVLRDIVVTWEPKLVIYTTPTAQQSGYAYEGSEFARLFGGVPGLMIVPTTNYRVLSYAQNSSLVSRVDTLAGTILPIPAFPEKCAADLTRSTTLWCAAPLALAPDDYPDAWYQGAVSFDDSIWKVDVPTGSATLISAPSTDVGEAIDVTDMQVSSAGDILLFINKKDGALWMQRVL